MATVGDEAQQFLDQAASIDAFQGRLAENLAELAVHVVAFNEAMEIAAIETLAPRRTVAQIVVWNSMRAEGPGEQS